MSENHSTTHPAGAGILSAADLKRRMAEREAAKAAEEARHMQEQETTPSGSSPRSSEPERARRRDIVAVDPFARSLPNLEAVLGRL